MMEHQNVVIEFDEIETQDTATSYLLNSLILHKRHQDKSNQYDTELHKSYPTAKFTSVYGGITDLNKAWANSHCVQPTGMK